MYIIKNNETFFGKNFIHATCNIIISYTINNNKGPFRVDYNLLYW